MTAIIVSIPYIPTITITITINVIVIVIVIIVIIIINIIVANRVCWRLLTVYYPVAIYLWSTHVSRVT